MELTSSVNIVKGGRSNIQMFDPIKKYVDEHQPFQPKMIGKLVKVK